MAKIYANRVAYAKTWTCDPNDPRLFETDFTKKVKLVPERYREETIRYLLINGFDSRGNKINN